jgi:hypothetical protein
MASYVSWLKLMEARVRRFPVCNVIQGMRQMIALEDVFNGQSHRLL